MHSQPIQIQLDLEYNKKIKKSEVSFPEEFYFRKTEKLLDLRLSQEENIIVTPEEIKIISSQKTFIIKKDNISDFSVENYLVTPRSNSPHGKVCYKILINLKQELESSNSFLFWNYKTKVKQVELFRSSKVTKLFIFFIIQEISSKLNFPLKNSSKNEDDFDIPNFYNCNVVKNDNQNFIIRKDSLNTDNAQSSLYLLISFILITFIGAWAVLFIHDRDNNLLGFLFSMHGFIAFYTFLFIYLLRKAKSNQGQYISIDPFQITISKLKFFNAKLSHTKNIEFNRNITLEINKIESINKKMKENFNNFEVVLNENNDNDSTQHKIKIIDKISYSEAMYLVQKILSLSNKNKNNMLKFKKNVNVEILKSYFGYYVIANLLLAIVITFCTPYIILWIIDIIRWIKIAYFG